MRGSVYRRAKGNWWIKVELGTDENGKRIRRQQRGGSVEGDRVAKTRKEAEATLATILSARIDGSYVEPSRMTVGGFLVDAWLPAIQSSIRPSTFESYRINIERHIVPGLGAIRLQSLTAAHVNGFYAQLLTNGRSDGKGGLAPNTVKHIHTALRKALGDALRWSYVSRNVAVAANPPKASDTRREMKAWTAEELRTFLESVAEDRLYAAWLLAASTGMRRGEVLGLRWSDLDLDRASIGVRQALVQVGKELTFSSPKTARGCRSVALDPTTVSALRDHRKRQVAEMLALGGGYQDNGLVFCEVDGKPLRPDSFSKRFDRAVRDASVPKIRLHDLRHTHATLALQAGVHPKVVSERLGHATVSFTLDVYSHAVKGMQSDAAAVVANLVFGGQP